MPTSPRNATRVELLLALTCANLLGCAGGASAPPAPTVDPTPAPREANAAPPTGPAFVVYTPRSTLVVPVAGGAPIAAAEGFWIATDGSAALTIARRQVRVLRPGGHGLSPFELREREIIGVRFHREARALLGAMRDGAPRSVR